MENREMVVDIRQRGSLNEERVKAEVRAARDNGKWIMDNGEYYLLYEIGQR